MECTKWGFTSGNRGLDYDRLKSLFLLLALALTSGAAKAQTAQELVALADKVRNPGQPFRLPSPMVSGKVYGCRWGAL